MKSWLTLTAIAVVVAALGAYVFLRYTEYCAQRSLSAALQSPELRDMFEGAVGQALFTNARPGRSVVVHGVGINALLAPSSEPQGPGLIEEYKQNPEKFRRYAKLYETAQNALRLGQYVQQQQRAYHLPVISFSLKVPADEKVDAWGHPYCISRIAGSIAVVSGGPEVPSFSCAQQRTGPSEIVQSSRPVLQTQLGEVVVIMRQGASQASGVAR